MGLSDEDILREIGLRNIVIAPYIEENVQPASVDVSLAAGIKVYKPLGIHEKEQYDDGIYADPGRPLVDIAQQTYYMMDRRCCAQCYLLPPKTFALASTVERVELQSHIRARIDGKSSVGRTGLCIQNAGYIDPGFCGTITLELMNYTDHYIFLEIGQLIAQISFDYLNTPARHPYGHPKLKSHYQNQMGTTPSALEEQH